MFDVKSVHYSGQASELTKKARSPAQHLSLGMVPVSHKVSYIDCPDRFHPQAPKTDAAQPES